MSTRRPREGSGTSRTRKDFSVPPGAGASRCKQHLTQDVGASDDSGRGLAGDGTRGPRLNGRGRPHPHLMSPGGSHIVIIPPAGTWAAPRGLERSHPRRPALPPPSGTAWLCQARATGPGRRSPGAWDRARGRPSLSAPHFADLKCSLLLGVPCD